MATIEEILKACQIVVNKLAVGGGFSYHPANMVELSNHIAIAIGEARRLTPRVPDARKSALKKVSSKSKKVAKPARG